MKRTTRGALNVSAILLVSSIAAAATQPVTIYTSAPSDAQRMRASRAAEWRPAQQPLETETAVFVQTHRRFQSILGFGGAITDASAEVFATLPAAKQAELLNAYFDREKGLGYSLIRTSIHSTDFSSSSYTYVNDGDPALTSFSIDHDRAYRIPMIKRAIASAKGEVKVFVSPWSPPAFMKSNRSMLQGGQLLPEFRDAWARYFVRFIQAYEQEGIAIWGLTIQNEPMATQKWESVIYSAEAERDFLKNHLGPTLKQAGLGNKKIIIWDHNRDLLPHRAATILNDRDAADFVWGIGYHWYETWTGGDPMHANVAAVKHMYPDKTIFLTESAIEKFSADRYQHWPNGEKYGKNIINDLNSGSAGWTDWNILLDQHGGPNHVGNYCFAAVHADTTTGELIYTPIYYVMGHFAKFIRPQALRLATSSSRSILLATSFANPDGSLVTVVMNQSDSEVTYQLMVDERQTLIKIPPRAIQSLIY